MITSRWKTSYSMHIQVILSVLSDQLDQEKFVFYLLLWDQWCTITIVSRAPFYTLCSVKSLISMEVFVCMVHSVMSRKNHVRQSLQEENCWLINLGIFSSTIKTNILFGKEYDEDLFQRVVRATALDIVRIRYRSFTDLTWMFHNLVRIFFNYRMLRTQ